MPSDDPALARFKAITRLPSWEMRAIACRELLGAPSPDEACWTLERLLVTSQVARDRVFEAAAAVAMWIARAEVESGFERPPAARDLLLDSLREVATARPDVFPLASSLLGAPFVSLRARAHLGDGFAVEGLPRPSHPWALRLQIAQLRAMDSPSAPLFFLLPPTPFNVSFRGERAASRIADALDPCGFGPQAVLRLATVMPLPHEILAAIVLRWRQLARPQVREALALNRSAPPRLVTALLPVASALVLRTLASGRHPAPEVARCARALLAARAIEGAADTLPAP